MTRTTQSAAEATEGWPSLPVSEWAETRETLHLWLQVVGKVRLALAPMLNHWWQVPLYVSPRGLTTSAIPHGRRIFDMEFDFCEHQLHIRSSSGASRQVRLEPKPVAAFYRQTTAALDELGLSVAIWPRAVEIEQVIALDQDTEHSAYDPEHAYRFWGQLVAAHRVMSQFRARFIGKSSPVHFFWGALDMACTRFSGQEAPTHPGGAPNCGDWVMVESYSHEVSSCGFWPGGSSEGSFYSYAYPEPDGYANHPVRPEAAGYNSQLGEYVLPYEAVRTASDPEATLLKFLQTSYEAAAVNGAWNRLALEDQPERRATAGR